MRGDDFAVTVDADCFDWLMTEADGPALQPNAGLVSRLKGVCGE